MKVSLCNSTPSRVCSLIQVALETKMWQRKIKKYMNNLGWKALSFPGSSLLFYFQVFRFGELAARELLCSYFTASCAIKNTLSRATASRPRASFLRCISYFILYILRRDYPFFSGFSRMRFSLLLIIPAICKSSRLFKARSIWLFCMVS